MINLNNLNFLEETRILITGGTGSLGQKLTRIILDEVKAGTIVIYSRDEFKQYKMAQLYTEQERLRLRFFLGDVRDLARLQRAMVGVHYVIHAAALKNVPAAEYNPFEFVKTNVIGAENVIDAAIANKVKYVVALSDHSDFNELLILRGFPPKVIWIRLGNCSTKTIESLNITNELRCFESAFE